MVVRFILALVVAACIFIVLQMTGVFGTIGIMYRVWTLNRLEYGDVEAIPQTRQYLNSNDIAVRAAAAGGFGRIGQADAETISDLITKVDTDVPRVAESAAWSLGFVEINEPTDDDKAYQIDVLDSLIYALSHKNSRVRLSAAHAISTYGTRGIDAKRATEALVKCLTDQRMGYVAARALGDIGATDTAGDIAALLEDSPWHFQQEAAVALTKLQPLPVEVQAQLDELIENDAGVREAVEHALRISAQIRK
ncbi:HEAT repeat domain-containing protein [Gimesia aquarii]|uniref:HEAT repeat protein n=1 Tax=Gimesia aquarii TaxID=2527964 RepID=A0A517W2A4_9PLAN|nr:HEAT repeat domain-containing protein [Gimesia aquarii]QDT99388.1 HEAT repeat protein [Gimesia aquarii]